MFWMFFEFVIVAVIVYCVILFVKNRTKKNYEGYFLKNLLTGKCSKIIKNTANNILTEPEPKFCVKCEFCDEVTYSIPQCKKTSTKYEPKLNLVTGKMYSDESDPILSCSAVRALNQFCGRDAKWYQEKNNV